MKRKEELGKKSYKTFPVTFYTRKYESCMVGTNVLIMEKRGRRMSNRKEYVYTLREAKNS